MPCCVIAAQSPLAKGLKHLLQIAPRAPDIGMQHTTSKILHDYWNEVRADRPAPRRVEIEPSRIAAILPDTLIIERLAPRKLRFRLAGTRVCEHFGMELRGVDFLSLWSSSDQDILIANIDRTIADATGATLGVKSVTTAGRMTLSELILLPLSNSDGDMTRFMGAWSLSEPTSWGGLDYFVGHEIVDLERVYCGPKPNHRAPRIDPATPVFASEPAAKLIVHSRRRRFRVFDGGRMAERDC